MNEEQQLNVGVDDAEAILRGVLDLYTGYTLLTVLEAMERIGFPEIRAALQFLAASDEGLLHDCRVMRGRISNAQTKT